MLPIGATEGGNKAWLWCLHGSWFPRLGAEETEAIAGAVTALCSGPVQRAEVALLSLRPVSESRSCGNLTSRFVPDHNAQAGCLGVLIMVPLPTPHLFN